MSSASTSTPAAVDARAAPGAAGRAPGRWLTLALAGLLCAIWGSTWIVIRRGLTDLPPFTGAALRFLLAGAVFSALARPLARAEGGARPSGRLCVAMGLLNVAASYAVVYWTETVLPSGLVSLLWSVYPLLIALFGLVLLPGERIGRRAWIGLGTGFAGMAMLFSTDVAALGPSAVPAGLVLLLSPAASAVGNLVVKRHGTGSSSVLLNRNGMLIGGACLALLALATEPAFDVRFTPAAIGSILYLALFGTVLAFGVYFWLLRYAPAHVLALISYVTPVIALALGALFEGEPVGLHTAAGGALVLSGVALVMSGRSRGARRTRKLSDESANG